MFQKMLLRLLFAHVLLTLTAIFGFSSAVSALAPPDGTVIQAKGSFKKYFMLGGRRMKIADRFTFSELGVKKKDVLFIDRKELKEIEERDALKISPPKISGMFDMHEHYRAGGDTNLYLKVSGALGVAKTIFVPTGMGPDNAGYEEHMAALLLEQKKHPKRVIAFCSVNEADPEAPKIFEKCLKDGGRGLKLLVGHPNFYDVPIDSDIMKQLFEAARKHDVPVMVHISIITNPKAKEEFKRLLDEFPDVRVQFAHYCSTIYDGINLDQCAEFLDAYPNLFIDLSMGGGILRYFKYMTEPGGLEKIKNFLVKYQDRIFYGTDIILQKSGPASDPKWLRSRAMCDFSLHQEKWYRCPVMNQKGEYALLPGFEFSEDILRKLYIENPRKFLKLNEK